MKFRRQETSVLEPNLRELLNWVETLFKPSERAVFYSRTKLNPDTKIHDEELYQCLREVCKKRDISVLDMPLNYRLRGWLGCASRQWGERFIYLWFGMHPSLLNGVLVHELAHHLAGHCDPGRRKLKRDEETVAESVAYLVLQEFGIRTLRYSTEYIKDQHQKSTFATSSFQRHWDVIINISDTIIDSVKSVKQEKVA